MPLRINIFWITIWITILSFGQNNGGFNEGFKAGYKTGYCSGDIGCIAPLEPLPITLGTSSKTYLDGYNIGFSKGQQDRSNRNSNNVSKGQTIFTAPSIEEIQQTRLNNLKIEEQRLKIIELRRQINENYELKALKNPEIDMTSSNRVKLQVKTSSKKFKFNYYIPTSFNKLVFPTNNYGTILDAYSRKYNNGNNLIMTIAQYPNFLKDTINAAFERDKKTSEVIYGCYFTDSEDKLEIEEVLSYGTLFDMGIESGDVILVVDTISVTNYNDFVNATKKYRVGDTINLMINRDNRLFLAQGVCLKRYGQHNSEFIVSGKNAKMISYIFESDNYGDKLFQLLCRNYIFIEGGVIEVLFSVSNENSTPQLTEEFWKDYKRLFQSILNSISIE